MKTHSTLKRIVSVLGVISITACIGLHAYDYYKLQVIVDTVEDNKDLKPTLGLNIIEFVINYGEPDFIANWRSNNNLITTYFYKNECSVDLKNLNNFENFTPYIFEDDILISYGSEAYKDLLKR